MVWQPFVFAVEIYRSLCMVMMLYESELKLVFFLSAFAIPMFIVLLLVVKFCFLCCRNCFCEWCGRRCEDCDCNCTCISECCNCISRCYKNCDCNCCKPGCCEEPVNQPSFNAVGYVNESPRRFDSNSHIRRHNYNWETNYATTTPSNLNKTRSFTRPTPSNLDKTHSFTRREQKSPSEIDEESEVNQLKPIKIDLHGDNSKVAINRVTNALSTARTGQTFYIITGRGKHSPNGQPIIKPLVAEYVRVNGYNHRWSKGGGMVTVWM